MGNQEPIKTIMLLNSIEEARELSAQLSQTELCFEIMMASSFDHFISAITLNQVDFFILDWDLKESSAINMAEKLRKSNKYRKTPILFVTDVKDASIPMQYSALKIDLVISRPFNLNKLKIPLTEILERKFKRIIPENYEVLVLDNNPDILDIMSDHLKNMQHLNFDTCSSIKEAKQHITDKNYDLLLLDWNLDDGTCIDLLDYMRAKKQGNRLNEALVMVITGRDDVADIMTLLRYNVKDHIIKPFDYGEFEEKIIYAIERHHKAPKTSTR
jgi:DNA-binding response OmpR family regulator